MNGIKNKIRKFNYVTRHDFLTVENVVLALAIALCLLWTYQSVTAMSRNWELTERLAEEKKELELVSVEVDTAELENEYYRSEEYQELLARKYLDKKFKDENMIVMPENSEEAKNKHATVQKIIEEKDYTNFEKWMMYLFPDN